MAHGAHAISDRASLGWLVGLRFDRNRVRDSGSELGLELECTAGLLLQVTAAIQLKDESRSCQPGDRATDFEFARSHGRVAAPSSAARGKERQNRKEPDPESAGHCYCFP